MLSLIFASAAALSPQPACMATRPVDRSHAVCCELNEISETSRVTRGLVSSLTALVNTISGGEPPSAPRRREQDSLDAGDVLAGLRTDFEENEYLWSGRITAELYDEDCTFTDPTLSFAGLSTFERNLANLDPWIERFVPPTARSVELKSLRLVDDGAAVEAEWRMLGDLALPWRPRLDLGGRTRYTLGGEGGRISSYDEARARERWHREVSTPA